MTVPTQLTTRLFAAAAALAAAPVLANITIVGPAAQVASINLAAGATTGQVTLAPNPVTYLAGATVALKAQLPAEFPAWTFVYQAGLNGILNIANYDATSAGGLNGGGLLDATYTRANTDPAIADLFWIQMVSTNRPLGGNTSPYIDPRPNDDTLPFYWTLVEDAQAANGNKNAATYHYFDNSSRTAVAPTDSIFWRGELMLASWNHQDPGQVYVYDGLRWGWNLDVNTPAVPEPAAALLLVLGLAVVGGFARRPSGAGPSAAGSQAGAAALALPHPPPHPQPM